MFLLFKLGYLTLFHEQVAVSPPKPPPKPDPEVDDPLYLMTLTIPELFLRPYQVRWDATVFGIVNPDFPLYIKHEDLSEIAHGGQCLSISVLQLWILHLTETCMRAGNSDIYGFLEPQSIQRSGQSQFESESYIKSWMQSSQRDVYLGAYLNGGHWQMVVILPKEHLVVWFCSLHNKPDNYLKGIINSAIKGLDDAPQPKSKAPARWIVVKCNRQKGTTECGYYVMHRMSTIILGSFRNNWEAYFNDPRPLEPERLKALRIQWAQFYLRTRLRMLTRRTLDHPRPIVTVNAATGRGSGPHKEKFHSYLGVVAREKVPIVHNSWKDVPDTLKELVWNEILAKFDIPEALDAKKKFKSSLTSKFVFSISEDQHKEDPSVKYGFDAQIWEEFAATRKTPSWQDSLEEQVAQGEFVPQGRHDILSTAIGRPDHGGRVCAAGPRVTISQYYGRISRASSSSSIAFTKEQLAEIVVTVREQVMKELEEEKKQSLQAWKKELKDAIITDIFNGDNDLAPANFDLNVLGARVSTKESNTEIAVNPSGEMHVGRVTPPMGLYVQSQNCTKLVALAKIHDGPSTIHCVAYADDVVRVSVKQVIDGEAEVPLPTSEIKYVRDVVNTFIAWPLPLVKLVSNEHSGITPEKVVNAAELNNDVPKQDPLRELIKTLVDIYDKPVEFVWDLIEFGIPNVNSSLFLTYTDVSKITSGEKCLNIAILQLWTMYMNEWSNGLGYRSVYGFLEPQSIHNAKDRRGQCEEYIEK
ncbi:hypothetical protein GmHk_14G040778 [Glycine max]|nr:hypothetical protein GmHk_14G040778 [Glycine max]